MSKRKLEQIHDAVLGRVGGERWVRLAEHLRSDADDRARYDRASLAMRALERRDVAGSELELVERWLEHDGVLAARRATRPAWGWARAWAWIGLAFGMAAAAVLALRPAPSPEPDERFTPKGLGYARPLGLQVLCDDGGAGVAAERMRDVAGDACPQRGTLSFAVRVDDRYTGGAALTLFGVDDGGEVLYYVPVPDDARLPSLVHGRWQSLSRAVKLAVNHRVGRVRVYGLLSPTPASLDAIDEAAAVLARAPIAGVDDPPWHERFAGTLPMLAACAAPGQCASAELDFRVAGDSP